MSLSYAVAAAGWILFSDQWLTYLTDVSTVARYSTAKGLAFVVVTAALLFMALRTAAEPEPPARTRTAALSGPLLVVFLVLAVAIGLIASTAFRIQSGLIKDTALLDLKTATELKVSGISRWLDERRANALVQSRSPIVVDALDRWLATGRPEYSVQIQGFLRTVSDAYGLAGVSLIDAGGRRLLDDGRQATEPPVPAAALRLASESPQPLLLDLERYGQDGSSHMGFLAPLKSGGERGGAPRVLGFLHYDIDARSFLFPFLERFVPGGTPAETLLGRLDLSDIVFLNQPLHIPSDAGRLRLPVATAELPMARAFRQGERVMEGIDYRGVPVLAAALPVPGTAWMLVTKVDRDEALVGVNRLAAVTGGLTAAALLVAAVTLALLGQRQRLRWACQAAEQGRQLADSEAKFRSYIEYAPIAVFVVDENGRNVDSNPAAVMLLGYDAAELRGMALTDFVAETDKAVILADFAELCEAGWMERDYQCVHRNGGRLWVQVRAIKISDTRYMGFCQDITERLRAEQALRESAEALREAQDVARLGSYVYDIAENRWTSSAVLDEIFGIGAGYQRTAEGWAGLVRADQRTAMVDYFAGIVAQRLPFDREYPIVRSSAGDERWVHGLGKVDYDATGTPLRLVGTIQDITERKRAEETALQANVKLLHASRLSVLGEVASTVAHEVNQPIGAAKNYLQAMRHTITEPVLLAILDKADRQLTRAADTVRKVREFAANHALELRPEAVRPLVDDACVLGLLGAAARGVRTTVSIPAGLPDVQIDRVQIQQILVNVIRNAVEAVSDAETRTIEISASFEPANRMVGIAVADSGPGIPEAIQGRLFTAFTTTKPNGTGLGLSTSRSIAEAHGGRLWPEGRSGGGTVFHLTLPVVVVAGAGAGGVAMAATKANIIQ